MKRSLKNIALIVSLGTFASKIGGLVRQLLIAGAFGIGAAYDAYNYAYILPGFFLVLLGGINGPFHNAIVSILSRKSKSESTYIISSIASITSIFLIIISIILVIFANNIITLVGPGLTKEIHDLAVIQLKIMSPIAFISGLIGLGFGLLNANNKFFIPSISPVISSISVITFVGIFWITKQQDIGSENFIFQGGMILAISTVIGAFLQVIIQVPSLVKNGFNRIRILFDFRHKGVQEVLRILGPATFSAGMLQINVFTDLFFASNLLGAAAGLSYANFLIQAPLGLISNALLIPLLPTFSRLSDNNDERRLIKRISQGLIFSSSSMIALGTVFVALSDPIVEVIYQRGAFNKDAVHLVSGLLIAYGLGMPVYLARDLLVRVFYSIKDGDTPFKISLISIILNIIFDWILIGGPSPWGNQIPINFGAKGLVLATVFVNLVSCILLIVKLKVKLKKLPLLQWSIDNLKLLISGLFAGYLSWLLQRLLVFENNFISQLFGLTLCILVSLTIFIIIGTALGVKEINELIKILKTKTYSGLK